MRTGDERAALPVESSIEMRPKIFSDAANDRAAEARKVRRIASERGLVSYMNDTKWTQICASFFTFFKPSPRYRVRDLLAAPGYISDWDREWTYHPYPYLSIHWMEVELAADQIERATAMCKRYCSAVEVAGAGLRIWGWVGPEDKPVFA